MATKAKFLAIFGGVTSPTTVLCLALYRLSWPRPLKDCMGVFGHERVWLSTVFNDVTIWDSARLTPQTFTLYCERVADKGEPSGKIWGFIDGTFKVICRPDKRRAPQRPLYSGYKKHHGLVFQGIDTPDGLMSS
ncbi:hypothetical protein FN846DRAFT_791557, partial [Sphaerosporella brunnea]